MTKKELAIAYHNQKYNCAQAVAMAFAEEAGIDKELLFKVCEGCGLGMGGMEGTCGAVTGAVILAGLKNSDGNFENPGTKAATYQLSREIVKQFREKNGTSICGELKGIETGKVLRSCPDSIMDAVEIVEDVLKY